VRFEGSARAGELLALRIRAFVTACCVPREWLPREFLQATEIVALRPDVPSRLKDGFRCAHRSAWPGIYFVENKLRASLGRNPLGDPYCLGQPSLVPFIRVMGPSVWWACSADSPVSAKPSSFPAHVLRYDHRCVLLCACVLRYHGLHGPPGLALLIGGMVAALGRIEGCGCWPASTMLTPAPASVCVGS
jgi:hypothetical protein